VIPTGQALPPPNLKNPVRVIRVQSIAIYELLLAIRHMNAAATAVMNAGFPLDVLKQDVGDSGDGGFGIDGLMVEIIESKDLWLEAFEALDFYVDEQIRLFSGGLEDSEPQGEE
jgi:hypothetical protein